MGPVQTNTMGQKFGGIVLHSECFHLGVDCETMQLSISHIDFHTNSGDHKVGLKHEFFG